MRRARCRIEEWAGSPPMDPGAPVPAISVCDDQLHVAYAVSRSDPANEREFAVVRFDGVLQHTFGYPNNEALGGPPLYSKGLKFYAFNEVVGSPYLLELGKRNARNFPGTRDRFTQLRHWIVPFHDETLEVVGDAVVYLGAEAASSSAEALSRHGTGERS